MMMVRETLDRRNLDIGRVTIRKGDLTVRVVPSL